MHAVLWFKDGPKWTPKWVQEKISTRTFSFTGLNFSAANCTAIRRYRRPNRNRANREQPTVELFDSPIDKAVPKLKSRVTSTDNGLRVFVCL